MEDVIIQKKAREKKGLLKSITDTTALAEVAQALNSVVLVGKYMWAISNANIDVVKKLELTSI